MDLVAVGAVAGRAVVGDPGFAVDAARFVEVEGDWARSTQQLHALVARSKAGEEFLASFDDALEIYRATPEYAAAMAELEGRALDRVVLRGEDSTVALQLEDGSLVQVPRGSEAVALDWPEELVESSRVQVKITSGPATGRMGTVSIEDVEVAP